MPNRPVQTGCRDNGSTFHPRFNDLKLVICLLVCHRREKEFINDQLVMALGIPDNKSVLARSNTQFI